MYKVMIVDDEKPGREILKYLVDWDKTNFTICATAKHGKDAIEQYDSIQPDLIITDIQMPVMDGLEMISRIKRINSKQEFIILSCYEDFSYAQKAIRLGISDYLIKGLVSEEDLYSILCKIEENLSERAKVQAMTYNSGKNINIENSKSLEKLFFDEQPLEVVERIIKDNSLNIVGERFIIICVSIDQYSQRIKKNQVKQYEIRSIQNSIQNFLHTKRGGECVYCGNGNFMIITPIWNYNSQMKFINECTMLANGIRKSINQQYPESVTIIVSDSFFCLSEIHKNVQQTLKMLEYRIFAGYNKTIMFNTYLQRIRNISPEKINFALDNAKLYLDNKDFSSLKNQIKQIFNQDIKGFMQLNYLNYVNSRLMDAIILFANSNDLSYNRIFGFDYIPLDKLNNFQTISEIVEWYNFVIDRMQNHCKSSIIQSDNVIVKKVVKYVEEHFDKGSISLDSLASHINVHKVYLCRIFKKETNLTISNYVSLLKIRKAKELLQDHTLKIFEVSDLVGYSSPSKFNVAFKNVTGQTPKKYRETVSLI